MAKPYVSKRFRGVFLKFNLEYPLENRNFAPYRKFSFEFTYFTT